MVSYSYPTMKKMSTALTIILLLLVISSPSFAQTATDEATTTTSLSTDSPRIKPLQTLKKQPIKELILKNREQAKQQFAQARQTFQEKLAAITDERKQKIVEYIDQRIQSINQNKINNFSSALERLSNLLENFKKKAETAKTEGQNTASVDIEIAQAEDALQKAQTAIASQAANDYTLTIQDEDTLRETIGKTVSKFRTDLVATHKILLSARKEVADVARELSKLRVAFDTTATESAE